MDQITKQNLAKFFSEIGMFHRQTLSGPVLAGLPFPEYLSPHIVRACQIAHVLAFLEQADPQKTVCLVLFHDNAELRTGDQNKISSRYWDKKDGEQKALEEQVSNLPKEIADRILAYQAEFDHRNTREGIVAKDAEWLATAIRAKELSEQGFAMQNWIDNVAKALETESAKELLEYIRTQDDFTNSWWQGLKKMTYQKLENKNE
ncbi:HD domain-containing protein [Candidatus Beckwithbacteria bacterium]|nr:HD domain-containing protein [Candidatus Beckwithbacteria bacterium]